MKEEEAKKIQKQKFSCSLNNIKLRHSKFNIPPMSHGFVGNGLECGGGIVSSIYEFMWPCSRFTFFLFALFYFMYYTA